MIAATSRNLEDLVAEGKFREDLYYRLNAVPIFLPPLRDRREDIGLLSDYFLKKYNRENNTSVRTSADVLQAFSEYEWPGNVRELENTVERLVVMAKGSVISKSDLPLNIREQPIKTKYSSQMKDDLPATVEAIEKTKILDALDKAGWVQAKAARLLGISPRQIGYRIMRYGLSQKRE